LQLSNYSAFSGPCQRLPFDSHTIGRGAHALVLESVALAKGYGNYSVGITGTN